MKRVNRRFKFLLIMCGLSGLIALPLVASYSHATISNVASIRITDAKNALIAVNLQAEEVCFPGNTIEGTITNNMSVPLTFPSTTGNASIPSSLDPGEEGFLAIRADGSGLYSGEIQAYWQNGSAKVPYSIDVTVINPTAFVTWDADLAQVVVANNNSGHDLEVVVGNWSGTLTLHNSLQFEPTGETTAIIFVLGQRSHAVSIDTKATTATMPAKEEPQKDEPMEGPPAEEAPRGEQETINTANNNLPVSEETISAGDDTMPEGETEAIEQFIEP